jgi:hypothetical protein
MLKKQKRDSKYEDYFSFWLDELIEYGFVVSYKEQVTEKLFLSYLNLNDAEYTYDFEIEWDVSALNVLCAYDTSSYFVCQDIDNKLVSYVEIKPEYDFKNSLYTTTLKIKWLYQLTGLYVNIIKPLKSSRCLFAKTFKPKKCLVKLNFKSIEEWLEHVVTAEKKSNTKVRNTPKKPKEKTLSVGTARRKVK